MFLAFRYVQHGAPAPTHGLSPAAQHQRGPQQAGWALSLALRRGRKSRLRASLDPAACQCCRALPFGLCWCLEGQGSTQESATWRQSQVSAAWAKREAASQLLEGSWWEGAL